jgi:SAM-dependent methyltransferase
VKCRGCGGRNFGDVIDLGLMPLVNNLLKSPDDPCPRWPLKVVFCRQCSLAQLTETPPPQQMFDEYLYFSSQSQTMVEHAGRTVNRFVKPGQRVLEIASNDGYLLKQARDRGATVLGVDPAQNIAAHANQRGIPTLCEYFNASLAQRIVSTWCTADVIFANNVLAHVPDPNEIAAGIKVALAAGGIAHIEIPYLARMIQSRAFDTIYHEHQCYFSLTALKPIFNAHGLRVVDVEIVEIHGGSLHLQLTHGGDESLANRMIDQEQRLGVREDSYYRDFSQRVRRLREELKAALGQFETVVGYGAAAKGVVLLNFFGLDNSRVLWVADVSPHKQGRFVPGTRQRVVSPGELLRSKIDAALLLPWNIKDEVVRRNAAYLNQGGCFIVPIPEVHIIRVPTTVAVET